VQITAENAREHPEDAAGKFGMAVTGKLKSSIVIIPNSSAAPASAREHAAA